jgi:hypothetical protein
MSNDQYLKNSLNDLAFVQRLLKKVEGQEFSMPLNKFAIEVSLFFQSFCLVLALLLVWSELATSGQITSSIIIAAKDTELGLLGMNTVLIILFGLVVIFYYLAWRASVSAGRNFNTYMEVNFKFLKNLSLFSDLIVKFSVFYLLVMAGLTQFVSVLLVIFIADDLIQGRYFNLPLKNSMMAGTLSYLIGFILYYFKIPTVIYPLILFSMMTFFSLMNLFKMRRLVEKE